MNKYIAILFIILFSACAGLSSLKKFKGSGIETFKREFGEPTRIVPLPGREMYIYEVKTELGSTEINKGQGTLDPMITPAAVKTERTIFIVIDGIVKDIQKEVEYTRK